MWFTKWARSVLQVIANTCDSLSAKLGNPGTGKTVASVVNGIDAKIGDPGEGDVVTLINNVSAKIGTPGEGQTVVSLLEEIINLLSQQ